jgi:hypothetical protein
MMKATYFLQVCPTCGRRLQVRIEYLGKVVACQHCHGRFEARDPETGGASAHDSSDQLIDRVEELLASADAWIMGQRLGSSRMDGAASDVMR